MRPSLVRQRAPFRAAFLACFLVGLWLVAACSSSEPSDSPQTIQCAAPNQVCNGACTNVAASPLHCGACGKACAANQACSAGVCVATTGSAGSGSGGASAAGSANGGAAPLAGAASGGASLAGASTGGASTGGTGTATAGTSTGGASTAGSSTGGSSTGGTSTAGTSAGGSAGSTGTGGSGTSVPEASSCPKITWPTANGSKNLGSGIKVGGSEVYDGGMAVHEGSLEDCSQGDQDSVDPLIEVANGGTVKNVIMGKKVGDGIHCLGSCTIENVWFPNVCDDAISAMGSGTVSIKNSGFKNARDKTIQHNGAATVNIDTVYVETAGKLYRSCGEGCSGSAKRSATLSNIVAIGVDQVAGVSENDTVTMKNICVHRTFSICSMYEPGSSTESTKGVSGSNEGPSANCKFTAADTHALLSKVKGVPFTSEAVCGGPNGYKSGSTATNCVSGFDKCLKACAPGGYGFKEIACKDGRYSEGTGAICALPTEATAAQNLAPARVMSGATAMVSNNGECSTEWGLGIESSNNANYCVCVRKPGYYKHDNWLSWDCQRRWW